jgi:hypothetical protein
METRLQEQRESLEEMVRAPGRRRERPVESGHAVRVGGDLKEDDLRHQLRVVPRAAN